MELIPFRSSLKWNSFHCSGTSVPLHIITACWMATCPVLSYRVSLFCFLVPPSMIYSFQDPTHWAVHVGVFMELKMETPELLRHKHSKKCTKSNYIRNIFTSKQCLAPRLCIIMHFLNRILSQHLSFAIYIYREIHCIVAPRFASPLVWTNILFNCPKSCVSLL